MTELAHVRDFLMRVAFYQSTEFTRDDLRKEARLLVQKLDAALKAPALEKNGNLAGNGHVPQGERPVAELRQPNFPAYFPSASPKRGPGRPRKTPA